MNQLAYSTDDQIITVDVSGPQTKDTVEATLHDVQTMQAYFDVGFSDTKLLIDTRQAGRVSGSAIPASIKFLNTLEYVAVAIIRKGGFMTSLVDTIVQHTPKDMTIRMFDAWVPAYRWLASANATSAHVLLDDQWRIVTANQRAREASARQDGVLLGKVEGKSIYALYPNLRGTDIERLLKKAWQTQQMQQAELWYPPNGRCYRLQVFPSPQTLAIYYTDITDRYFQAADQLLRGDGVAHLNR